MNIQQLPTPIVTCDFCQHQYPLILKLYGMAAEEHDEEVMRSVEKRADNYEQHHQECHSVASLDAHALAQAAGAYIAAELAHPVASISEERMLRLFAVLNALIDLADDSEVTTERDAFVTQMKAWTDYVDYIAQQQ